MVIVKKEKMNVAPLVEQKKKIKSEIINDLSGVLDKVILAKVAVGTPDMNEILKEIGGKHYEKVSCLWVAYIAEW